MAAQTTVDPKKTHTDVAVSKKQPREERLRIPCKDVSHNYAPLNSTQNTLPVVEVSSSRGSSESSQTPGPPVVVESQSSAGADSRGDTSYAWQSCGPCKGPHDTYRERQSEVSNVLDYYLRDHLRDHPRLPGATPVQSTKGPATTVFNRVVCESGSSSRYSNPHVDDSSQATSKTSRASVDKSLPPVPLQQTPTYSLFPMSGRTPSMDRYMRDVNPRLPVESLPPCTPVSLGISNPTRPRKVSLPSFLRSRADSCTSTRLLPSATIIPGNKLNPGKFLRRPLPIRVSSTIPTSPLSDGTSRSSPPTPRWSGETVTRSLDSPGAEKQRNSTSSTTACSPPWPETGSFFEIDDDDEAVPLRKKVATKIRGARAWSSSTTASELADEREQKGLFRRWALCCGGARQN